MKEKAFTAGELARMVGVSSDTLRHYERKGVIPRPQRDANGYRRYPAETLARLRLARQALGIGFTLDELAQIFAVRDRGGKPCEQVRKIAAEKLARTEEQLRELTGLRDQLRSTLGQWDARLAATPRNKRAGLLDSLSPHAIRRASAPPFSSTNKPKTPNKK